MSEQRLTETSYLVLGMLEFMQPATPYELKRVASLSTMSFWPIPHSQLYTECARLAKEDLLSEVREQTGRRRRIYSVTTAGLRALDAWRAEPGGVKSELRDLCVLKLFLGADPVMLARAYLPEHEAHLRHYEALHNVSLSIEDTPRGPLLALEAGIAFLREYVRFWKRLLEQEDEGEDEGKAPAEPDEGDPGGEPSGRPSLGDSPGGVR